MSKSAIDRHIENSHFHTEQVAVVCPSCEKVWQATLNHEYGGADYANDSNVCPDCDVVAVSDFEIGILSDKLKDYNRKMFSAILDIGQLSDRKLENRINKVEALLDLFPRSIGQYKELGILTHELGKDWVTLAKEKLADREY